MHFQPLFLLFSLLLGASLLAFSRLGERHGGGGVEGRGVEVPEGMLDPVVRRKSKQLRLHVRWRLSLRGGGEGGRGRLDVRGREESYFC